MASSEAGLRSSSKAHFPKPNLHQKKVMVTGSRLTVGSTTAFWIPVKPLYLRSMLSKLMRCTDTCSTLHPAVVNRKGPVLLHNNAWLHIAQPTRQKLNGLGHKGLPHPPHSPDFLPINYHFFKHLPNICRENTSTTSRRQKMFPRVHQIPKQGFLY